MTDVKQFADFLDQMDWEGGVEAIVCHGFDTSGDQLLDDLLGQVDYLLQGIRIRIDTLSNEHREEIDRLQKENTV